MQHPAREEGIALADTMRGIAARGLSAGTSGNASLRTTRGFLITPTGVAPDALGPDSAVELELSGTVLAGHLLPSSEWPMHAAIYAARADAKAIVHCHSRHATALACCGLAIPAFHYMVAVAGGDSIRCAPYALFGSAGLAAAAVEALAGRRACLLGNHGQITIGHTPAEALALAVEVEELSAQYLLARQAGTPRILDAEEMREVLARFGTYGQQRAGA